MPEAERVDDSGKSPIALLIAVLLIPAALGSSHTIFSDGDVSWHIATGQWILNHRAIPTTDPFSYTWGGKPWVPIEWLAELLYASAYRLAGYAGVSALVTAALMALHTVVFFNASRWIRVTVLPIIAMDLVLIPMMFARPHLLVWPLLALWVWVLLRAREHDRAPPIASALLMTLWANLHGSFVIGLGISAVFGVEALVASADKRTALRQWLTFGAACAAAVCINGNGFEGVVHPLRFTRLAMLPLIDEWQPSSLSLTPFFFGVLAITLGLIVWKRPRLHPVRWLLLAALLGAAMLQVRHQAMLAIVAAMLLPDGFAQSKAMPAVGSSRTPVIIAAAGAVLLVVVRAIMPLTPPDNEANPWKLIAAVPPELRAQPVINDYTMGGPLILSGIRPYVDGRGDMYGDDLIVPYFKIEHGDARLFAEAVARWNIRWAILSNSNTRFIEMLNRTPGWRRIYQDQVGMIYVRDATSASGSPRAPASAAEG